MLGPIPDAPSNRPLPPAVALLAVGLCVLFGGNAVAIKLALPGFGPLTLVGLRLSIAAAAITAWALLTRQPLALRPGQVREMALLGLVTTVQMGLFYLGMDRTLASRGLLIGNLQPFLVLIGAHFALAGERFEARKLAGVVLGFAGVALVFGGGADTRGADLTGDLLVLGAVLLWSGTTVFAKRIIDAYEPFHIALYPMFVEAPLLLLAGLLFDPVPFGPAGLVELGALLYQGLVTAGLAFVLWTQLVKAHGAVALNTVQFAVPLSGAFLAWLVLGEPVAELSFAAGTALVAAGIFLVNRRGPR
jgi:drug/metabolite transporter (DMT)-like permease